MKTDKQIVKILLISGLLLPTCAVAGEEIFSNFGNGASIPLQLSSNEVLDPKFGPWASNLDGTVPQHRLDAQFGNNAARSSEQESDDESGVFDFFGPLVELLTSE